MHGCDSVLRLVVDCCVRYSHLSSVTLPTVGLIEFLSTVFQQLFWFQLNSKDNEGDIYVLNVCLWLGSSGEK